MAKQARGERWVGECVSRLSRLRCSLATTAGCHRLHARRVVCMGRAGARARGSNSHRDPDPTNPVPLMPWSGTRPDPMRGAVWAAWGCAVPSISCQWMHGALVNTLQAHAVIRRNTHAHTHMRRPYPRTRTSSLSVRVRLRMMRLAVQMQWMPETIICTLGHLASCSPAASKPPAAASGAKPPAPAASGAGSAHVSVAPTGGGSA